MQTRNLTATQINKLGYEALLEGLGCVGVRFIGGCNSKDPEMITWRPTSPSTI